MTLFGRFFKRLGTGFGSLFGGLTGLSGDILPGLGNLLKGAGNLWENTGASAESWFDSKTGRALTGAQREQNQFEHDEAELAYQRQIDYYNQFQSPDAMMRQYREAGLNPALMMTGGNEGAVSPISPPQASGTSAGSQTASLGDIVSLFSNLSLIDAQRTKLLADAKNTDADTGLKEAQTQGQKIANEWLPEQYGANIESVKANTATLQDALKNNEVQRELMRSGIDLNEANIAVALKDAFLRDQQARLNEALYPLQVEQAKIQNRLSSIEIKKKASEIANNWQNVEKLKAEEAMLRRLAGKYENEADFVCAKTYNEWLDTAYKSDALPLDLKAKEFNVGHLQGQYNWHKVGVITGAVKDAAVSVGAIYGAAKMGSKPAAGSKPSVWTPEPSRPLSAGERMWLNNHPIKP